MIMPALISLFTPHFASRIRDQSQLGPLIILGEQVAFRRRGKAALRADCELLEREHFSGFVNPF